MSTLESTIINPIEVTLHIPSDDDVETTEDSITNTSLNVSTILFDPAFTTGIHRLELLNIKALWGVGIADESVIYNQNESPAARGQDKIVYYKWECLNMDSDPRTLTFFVNGEEQKYFVSNVPDSVRFWAYILDKGASFKILKFESLSSPKAQHEESRALKWGKEWIKDE
ncbi:MAG: hypothetical protein EZS28_036047 [Streblomastix strix]|uniref:Uncharacterized protein n=1 Tax=Streblomastix strix TaxID=222440 RepID=A0A5J4UFT1_9EUKA|nr:MAG: hypothetical protein EZS28_036047 [Streblomastix strix]